MRDMNQWRLAAASTFCLSIAACAHWPLMSMRRTISLRAELNGYKLAIPLTHSGHRTCDFFGSPQPGHLVKLFTSFNALPAICRCRFFMWEVFFLGTARRTDSQRPARNEGISLAMYQLRTGKPWSKTARWYKVLHCRDCRRTGDVNGDRN